MMGDEMVKNSPFGGTRKRLSDITNLQTKLKSPAKEKENTPAFDDSHTKIYIEQLLKENAALMKHIQERDKVIESAELEMQKLRVIVQKTQLQNWQLAQANSQMLAELNVGKDRLKALQHELACKDALIKVKTAELEERTKIQHPTNRSQGDAKMQHKMTDQQECESTSMKESADQLQDNDNDDSKLGTNKKRHPTKSQSMGPMTSQQAPVKEGENTLKIEAEAQLMDKNNTESNMATDQKKYPSRSQSMGPTTSQQTADKDMAENKRRCLRRQSARLKPHQEPQGDFFEIDVTDIRHQSVGKPQHKSSTAGFEEGFQESSNALESQRSSLGRPLRTAVGKIQSYKEPSRRQKMRRLE